MALAFLNFCCHDSSPTKEDFAKEGASIDSTIRAVDEVIGKNERGLYWSKEKSKRIFDSLKSHFFKSNDEFEKISWYTHKILGDHDYWSNRCTIVARVRNDGFEYMESNFHGSDWIFHNKITVLIGDKIIESPFIPTYSKDHKTDNNENGVWEVNCYNQTGDNGILKAISEDTNAVIKVRFQGDQKVRDVILSKADKKAISESNLLSAALSNL